MSAPLVALKDVGMRYPGHPPVDSLSHVDLQIEDGEMTAVLGPSGSGKTTLLHVIGTLDRPTEGVVRVAGAETSLMSEPELCAFRANRLGFVFQQFFLLEGMSVLDNVACGLLYRGMDRRARRNAAALALQRVGLGARMTHRPNQLSGGERQRVAIARAVAGKPRLVLADEPTGNLDSASGAAVLDLLAGLNREGTTVVVITHNHELAASMSRQVVLRDGRIAADSRDA